MDRVERFRTAGGRSIYLLPIEAFPGFNVNTYLVAGGERLTLVDCGTGTDEARRQLLARSAEVRDRFDASLRLEDVELVLVTHGHIDHFGGLGWIKELTGAPAAVHVLDRRVLSHYEERVIVASKAVAAFLERAGVAAERRAQMMEMYLYAKGRYRSTAVELELAEGTEPAPGIEVFHVPGHCPGQVCLKVDDVLLTADHVLSRTTPSQAPESITQLTGLGHYFESLAKISRVEGVRVSLGGHEDPIEDLGARVAAIRALHETRLEKLLELAAEPRSVADMSRELFGTRRSYHVLLAVCETGAHVEYLYQRGELCAANLDEIERELNPVVRYRRC